MNKWRDEAIGIPVFRGALVWSHFTGRDDTPTPLWDATVCWVENNPEIEGPSVFCRHRYGEGYAHDPVLDLRDSYTQAAFDRRLCLRFGAPPDASSFAVELASNRVLHLAAAFLAPLGKWTPTWCAQVGVDTDDPLLARVRAWKSAPDPKPAPLDEAEHA